MEFLGFDVPVAIGHPGDEHVICVVRNITTPALLAAACRQGLAAPKMGAWLVAQHTASGELSLLTCCPCLSAAFNYGTAHLGVVSYHEMWDTPLIVAPRPRAL